MASGQRRFGGPWRCEGSRRPPAGYRGAFFFPGPFGPDVGGGAFLTESGVPFDLAPGLPFFGGVLTDPGVFFDFDFDFDFGVS